MKTKNIILSLVLILTVSTVMFGQVEKTLSKESILRERIEPDGPDGPYYSYYYRDYDRDGYGDPSYRVYRSYKPYGYVTNNRDCDDHDRDVTIKKYFYVDADGDGYGNPLLKKYSCFAPTGYIYDYVDNKDDCDDNNSKIGEKRYYYLDADGDGKGSNNSAHRVLSCTKPNNYVENNDDCNDNDASIYTYTWYKDIDGDGFGDPAVSMTRCTKPYSSWVLNDDDQCPEYPGKSEYNGCPIVEHWNTTLITTYAIDDSVTSKSKTYFDNLGKSVQSQSLDIKTNRIWANQTLYDSQGRPAFSTLSAPIVNTNNTFRFKSNFIKNTDGTTYSISDFEGINIDLENGFGPKPIGNDDNSLGWYYSDLNTDAFSEGNSFQDITSYPFTRTIYSELSPGSIRQVIGGNKVDIDDDGDKEWITGYTFSMKAGQELSQTVAFGDTKYNDIKTVKTISRDVHGNEVVVFADIDGKTLAAARVGGDPKDDRTSTIQINEQGFVDIHVPKNTTGFTISGGSGINTEVYDLITERVIIGGPSTTYPSGFYRVSITNLESYNPLTDPVEVTYKDNYYDYSLNEYNKAGRLIASYQPLEKQKSEFFYNVLGQLIKTTSPDEGTAEFKYRKDGQIRFSQNSKQKEVGEFSFTNYDELARPIESGVAVGDFTSLDPDSNTVISGVIAEEKQESFFDALETDDDNFLSTLNAEYHNPTFLAGNVAKTKNPNTTTYYSYDIYGRVKWIVQDIADLGVKTIDYVYDPITGAVTKVDFQRHDLAERFIHKYTYNIVNELVKVETSNNDTTFTTQATYEYYETGALKRVEIADGLQGIDYVYNLGGQLKAINHPGLDTGQDPNGDTNDLFGMHIDYYKDDYLRQNTNISSLAEGVDQFNGNIKAVTWNTDGLATTVPDTYFYKYNKNNWLEEAKLNNDDDYLVSNIKYDANGNIQSLNRNKDTDPNTSSNKMDEFTYEYKDDKPNQLDHVVDAITDPIDDADDLETQSPGNYIYNSIGQLIEDWEDVTEAEYETYNITGQKPNSIIHYIYNASGLVTEVNKDDKPLVKFFYNDKGFRVKKEANFNSGIPQKIEYYIRDAAGSVMAIYNKEKDQTELPIYGASRIGVHYKASDSDVYQLTDHLGNVRAVVEKVGGIAVALTKTDYYPFGMAMPNRQEGANSYRYTYQGQEKDQETGKEAFQLRLWDGRIGRWLTTDPAGQYASPYLGMGNNPITRIDPDGGCDEEGCSCGNAWFSSWFSNLSSYFTGWGKANDELSNAMEVTNYSDKEIKFRDLDRLNEGMVEAKYAFRHNLVEHTSIKLESQVRGSFGSQFAGGVDGFGKVEAGAFALNLFEYNPSISWSLSDGFTFDLDNYYIINKDDYQLIHRAGLSIPSGEGVSYGRVDSYVNRKLIHTEHSSSVNYLIFSGETNISTTQTNINAGLEAGGSIGAFFVIDGNISLTGNYTK